MEGYEPGEVFIVVLGEVRTGGGEGTALILPYGRNKGRGQTPLPCLEMQFWEIGKEGRKGEHLRLDECNERLSTSKRNLAATRGTYM